VLVIVLSVGCVAMPAVHVVEVVAVLDGQVAAVLAVHVCVVVVGDLVLGRLARRERRP
jgi:hypothetical protein